jgi:hypothetical protein
MINDSRFMLDYDLPRISMLTYCNGCIKLPKYFQGTRCSWQLLQLLVRAKPFSRQPRMPPSIESTWV